MSNLYRVFRLVTYEEPVLIKADSLNEALRLSRDDIEILGQEFHSWAGDPHDWNVDVVDAEDALALCVCACQEAQDVFATTCDCGVCGPCTHGAQLLTSAIETANAFLDLAKKDA